MMGCFPAQKSKASMINRGLVYLGRLGGMLDDYDERVAGLQQVRKKKQIKYEAVCVFWWFELRI